MPNTTMQAAGYPHSPFENLAEYGEEENLSDKSVFFREQSSQRFFQQMEGNGKEKGC